MKSSLTNLLRLLFVSLILITTQTGIAQTRKKDFNISIHMQNFPERIAGITFDSHGSMYVAANGGQNIKRILKITSNSQIDTIYTIECFAIQNLKIARDSSVYVSAVIERGKENATIFKISPDKKVSVISDGFIQPAGLTFDTHQNLYVADAMARKIYRITPAHIKSVFIDLGEDPILRDNLYHGIEFSNENNSLFVAGINITGKAGNLLMYKLDAAGKLIGGPVIVSHNNFKHFVLHDNQIFATINNSTLYMKDIVSGTENLIDDPLLANSMWLSFGAPGFEDQTLFINTFDKIIKVEFLY